MRLRRVLSLIACLALTTCGPVRFLGGTSIKQGAAAPQSPSAPAAEDALPAATPTQAPTEVPTPDDDADLPRLKSLRVLIVDFKSGWLAFDLLRMFKLMRSFAVADGGAVDRYRYVHPMKDFLQVTDVTGARLDGLGMDEEGERILRDELTSVAHAPYGDALRAEELQEFDQVWFLSGSERDVTDLALDAPEFAVVKKVIAESRIPLYIASGASQVDHANALLAALGSGARFAADKDALFWTISSRSVRSVHSFFDASALARHPLLKGIDQVVNEVEHGGSVEHTLLLGSDHITGTERFRPLVQDGAGRPVVALARSDRKLLLDGGIQRLFASFHEDQAYAEKTRAYFVNVLRFLGR